MRHVYNTCLILLFAITTSTFVLTGCQQKEEEYETEENDEYDGPDKAIEFEIERTRDLSTGKVPWERLRHAIEQTEQAKMSSSNLINALSWIERGPDGDFYGPQGNTRPNSDQTSGRIRASIIDSLDPTHKTVWIGGVDGGLWKTTDITASPANWTLINDYLSNLAVSAICQDPRPGFQNIMYFCTGESFSNADAVRGVGVFKSIDAGATWNFLPSTSSYLNGTRIVCDFQGNVYLGTRNTGLLRSTNGGTTWTTITPSGIGSSVCDLEISSTATAGRLHVTTGIFSASGYSYTDIPATVTSGAGWVAAATPFTTFNQRTELAISGNTLYALPDNASHQVPTVWKSTDGGANWAATTGQPTSGWASGQGWYCLSAGINPSDPNECIVGGLDCFKTTNGGNSWTRISTWVGTSGQYVHADQHNIQWWDGGNKLMFNCDGGVHYSTNGGITITDRNKGLRIKQFYSIAIHPTSTNYFLSGAQDNGVHRLNHPGLDSSIEVYGGDGCYVAIDQNEPQFQFGSYVYNVYRRSTNNGASWSTPVNDQSTGRFVNPWDYDNNANIIYACNNAGTFRRWDNPQTGGTTNSITCAAFNGGNVSAVHASPHTANRVFFGTGGGGIIQVDNANVGTTVTGTMINTGSGMPAGYVNCVVTGADDQHMIACFTNYGVQNVWSTTNGGTTWTAIDGNLPDMPVRWALFHPDTDTKAFIATETGVWETDLINGNSTLWAANTTFPNVRTDMIKYRTSDRTIAAGTHGRGIWSAVIPSGCTSASIITQPSSTSVCTGGTATFTIAGTGTGYQWQISTTGAGGPWTDINNGGVYSGATTTTLTITGITAGMNNYQYRCVATGTCAPASATSTNVVLTVNAATNISAQPLSSIICANTNTSFSVTATGTALTYQWQISTNGGASFSNLTNTVPYSGVTTNILTITAAPVTLNANQYRCIISGSCSPLNSNAAILTVNPAPSFTLQPVSTAVCAGNSISFTATATGGSPAYQWQLSTDGGATFNNIGGATAATYSFVATLGQNNNQYRCVATGSCAPAATSTAATLTVGNTLLINSQPANSIVCAGATANFSVAVSGTVTYQWQESTDGGTTYNNITNAGIYSGATTASLTLTGVPAAANGYLYRCIISGNCPSINSLAGALTVNTAPAITTQPASSTICAAQNTLFSVIANGTALTYQWEVSTDGGVTFNNLANGAVYSNVTTATLNITGATATMNNYKYRCIIGGTCAPSATTSVSTLTVNTPVGLSANPANITLCENSNGNFSVTATGTAPSYQWQVSTNGGATFTNITNGTLYTGVTTAILTITSVGFNLNGNQYRCVVAGTAPCGLVNSTTAVLTVNPAPVQFTVTGGGSYCIGGNGVAVGISSSASGISYQLQLNGSNTGTPVAGTGNALNFGNKPAAGNYTVIATNSTTGCTNQMTGAVTVTVNPLPTVSLAAAPYRNLFPGLVTTLTATATSIANPVTYAWFKNNVLLGNNTNTQTVSIANAISNLGDYRVTVTDANGCVNQSQVISIGDSANNRLFIYPSPNDGKFTVSYYNQGGLNTKQVITIFSSKGEKVYNNEFIITQAYQLISIDLRRNGADLYYVVLSDAKGNKLKTGEVLVR